MIVDWQREPIKDQLIHIDMKRIALDKTLRVSVRVKLLGTPIGVKTAGGILDQVLREVEIECLPADIPQHIDVDVSNLEMHQALRVSGLPHSDKIKYLNSEDATVAHVISIREEAPTAGRSGCSSSGSGWSNAGGDRAGSCQEGQAGRRCGEEARSEEVSLGRSKAIRATGRVTGPVSGGGPWQLRVGVSVDPA